MASPEVSTTTAATGGVVVSTTSQEEQRASQPAPAIPSSQTDMSQSQSQFPPSSQQVSTETSNLPTHIEYTNSSTSPPQLHDKEDTAKTPEGDVEEAGAETTETVVPPADSPKITPPSNESAIGPSNENPTAVKAEADLSAGPVVLITLLLITGARHPFKIDGKYLRKRNVATDEKTDPFKISVYTMKELILRDWRDEWENKPSSPSAIRLIHFGKLLDDKTTLRDCRFDDSNPNVVHMTIKPQDAIDEEEAAAKMGKGGRDVRDGERSVGCRCVIL